MSRLRRIQWDGPEVTRFRYYLRNASAQLLPNRFYRLLRRRQENVLRQCDEETVFDRAGYYNKLQTPFVVDDTTKPFCFNLFGGQMSYQFDLSAGMRYFAPGLRVEARFGDNRDIPDVPTIVKSRPITEANQNAVLLKLNRVRHFYFVRDPYRFEDKSNMLVWRGHAWQEHRKAFLARYYDHPLCDVGHFHRRHPESSWAKPEMSIHAQLRYKYILAMEGKDVATNLKWVLSSQSLCFMTKPRFETWFMEGRLVAGQHYVQLRADYADLEDKISYYNHHPAEAREMIHAANQWVAQFQNARNERLIRLLVLWRYFYLAGQCETPPPTL